MSSPGYPTPVSPPAGPADNAHDGSAALVESLIGQPVGRLEYRDALVRFEQAAAELNGFGVDTLTPIDMLAVLERREAVRRAEAIIDHRIIARLAAETNPRELGAKSLPELLSTRLRISRYEARRRIEDTRVFGLRRALSGEPLQPQAPHTAARLIDGSIGPEHSAIIRDFIAHVPKNKVGVDELDRAEAQLADIAADYTPEQTRRFAQRLMCTLNPDGEFSDAERRRKRGVHIGKQDFTGMSPLSGSLTPECRAVFEAIFAKLAAPGMCDPESRSPCVDGTPSTEQIGADRREQAQRNHDALLTVGRAMLASGRLGQHNGLPVTVVLTATLQDLHQAGGHAVTGGGALVPMSMASSMDVCPSTTSPSSTSTPTSRCIWPAPNGSRPRDNVWCSSPATSGAPSPVVPPPATTAKCTTSTAGTAVASPTSSTKDWPVRATTTWLSKVRAVGKPGWAATAPSSGSRRHTWTPTARAPTPSTIPNGC